MSKSSHQQVTAALQEIMTKCGQNLYDKYLNTKLPADCNQKVVSGFEHQFGVMNMEKPQKNRISRQFMPRAASVDVITPMKISIKARQNGEIPKPEPKKLLNTEIAQSKQRSGKKQVLSANPTVFIKYPTKQTQFWDANEQRVREEKIKSDNIKSTHMNSNSNTTQDNRQVRRTLLERRIKELVVEGVPYAYDDDGNFIIPDIKQFKKEQQIQSKKKIVSKPFAIKFKALEMLSQGSELASHCKLLGRKKGYSSAKIQRKMKINEEQFTNKHQRQSSAIPFMTIESGIKIVEKDRNIMAERLHEPHLNRKQFVTESQKSLFKSYMPGSLIGNSVLDRRPGTHSHSRSKSKNFQSVGLSSALSLHSRPKTSRDRVNINNQQLAVEMVREQTISAFSRFI